MAPMKYFYELTVSSSPHAHGKQTTQTIMRDVLIALLPALIGSVYFFGFRALMVTLVSAAACGVRRKSADGSARAAIAFGNNSCYKSAFLHKRCEGSYKSLS